MTCRRRWCGRNRNGCLGKFNGMSSQSHVSHYRVRPFFWWIHCHDSRATCHIAGCSHLATSMSWSYHIAGCKNSNRHIENRFFAIFYYFLFLMQFRLWRAVAFVSSPIHVFYYVYLTITTQSYTSHSHLHASSKFHKMSWVRLFTLYRLIVSMQLSFWCWMCRPTSFCTAPNNVICFLFYCIIKQCCQQ